MKKELYKWWKDNPKTSGVEVFKIDDEYVVLCPGKYKLNIMLDELQCKIDYTVTKLGKIFGGSKLSQSEVKKLMSRVRKSLFPSERPYIISSRTTDTFNTDSLTYRIINYKDSGVILVSNMSKLKEVVYGATFNGIGINIGSVLGSSIRKPVRVEDYYSNFFKITDNLLWKILEDI